MTRRRLARLVAVLIVSSVVSAAAQTPAPQAQRPAPPTTYEQYIATVWKGVHNKILDMAKDFLRTNTARVLIRTHGRCWTSSGT